MNQAGAPVSPSGKYVMIQYVGTDKKSSARPGARMRHNMKICLNESRRTNINGDLIRSAGRYQTDSSEKRVSKNMPGMRRSECFTVRSCTETAFGNQFREQKKGDKFSGKTVTREKRQIFNCSNFPGPSDVDRAQQTKDKTNARIPTSRSERNEEYHLREEKPAPNQYQPSQPKIKSFQFSKSHSLSHLNPILSLNTNPGSGEYQLTQNQNKSKKGFSFGRSNRADFVSGNKAGVGDYEMGERRKMGSNGSLSRARRFERAREGPGPGDYSVGGTLKKLDRSVRE